MEQIAAYLLKLGATPDAAIKTAQQLLGPAFSAATQGVKTPDPMSVMFQEKHGWPQEDADRYAAYIRNALAGGAHGQTADYMHQYAKEAQSFAPPQQMGPWGQHWVPSTLGEPDQYSGLNIAGHSRAGDSERDAQYQKELMFDYKQFPRKKQ